MNKYQYTLDEVAHIVKKRPDEIAELLDHTKIAQADESAEVFSNQDVDRLIKKLRGESKGEQTLDEDAV